MAESLSESPPQQGPICPVCFRDYSDSDNNLVPRILQCGHTYCTECLERLLNMELDEEDNPTMIFNIHYAGRRWTTTRRFPSIFNPPRPPRNEIKCPTCKMENRIDNRDITTLTKNFALLGMTSQTSVTICPKKSHYCKDHDHEKRIYCRDCKTLICAYCQLYGEHKGHSCEIATEAAKPSVESLKEAKEKLVNDFEELTRGETVVNTAIVKLERNRERCERKVKRYFNRFIGRLKRRRDDLLLDIGSWTEDQMFILDAQLRSLSNAIKDSESIQANCQSLIEGEPLEALTQEEEILKEVEGIQDRVGGLSLHPIINPWIKCKLTRSEYDDSIDEILESCQLKFDTDVIHSKGGALDLSEDDASESESESSMLDDDDDENKELSDDNLAGEGQLSHGGGGVGGGLGGQASLRDRDQDNNGDDGDIDFLKRRARLLHSQETHMGVGGARGGASLMPKLELADPGGGVRRRWGHHPSSTTASSSLGVRHSLPLLSTNQASGLSSLRPSGSTPSNTPRHDPNDPMSPTQASKSSTSLLFNSNYSRRREFSDQLQRVMDSLNQQTTDDISEEGDETADLDSPPRESRHRLHIVEDDAATTFSMLDAYSHLPPLGARNHNNRDDDSDSSGSPYQHHHHHHEGTSFQVEDSDDEQSPSPHPYTTSAGSYVSTSVLDSIEALRRSRLLRGRVGEQSPTESDDDADELETTADGQNFIHSMMNSTGHTSTPNVPPDSTPSPLQTTEQEETDFAYAHHLSLPVDSQGQDSEVVFPRHYSWTADHGEVGGATGEGGGGGHGIRLQLEQNGTTVQVSIDSGDLDFTSALNVSTEINEGDREDSEEN